MAVINNATNLIEHSFRIWFSDHHILASQRTKSSETELIKNVSCMMRLSHFVLLVLTACSDKCVALSDAAAENKVPAIINTTPNLRTTTVAVRDDNAAADIMVTINDGDRSGDSEDTSIGPLNVYDFTQVDMNTSSGTEERAMISPSLQASLKKAWKSVRISKILRFFWRIFEELNGTI